MIVVRKNLSQAIGDRVLFPDERYFFYLTNDWDTPAEGLVRKANQRCHQENLIEQLKNQVHALRAPLDSLESNWAYMVMASLAWALKVWWGLLLTSEAGRWQLKHGQEKRKVLKMQFGSFQAAFMQIPCQIVHSGRRLMYRVLSWNPWQAVFWRFLNQVQSQPMLS